MSSLRKKIFQSLQNLKLGRRSEQEDKPKTTRRVPLLPPPDPSSLMAPVILGRPVEAPSGGQASNNYSGTPRGTSSEEDDTDDEEDDEDEDLNFNLMSDVVYTSLRVLPQTWGEKEEEEEDRLGRGEESDEDPDEDDDEEDDVSEDRPAVPVPAPRVSRLVRVQHEVHRRKDNQSWVSRHGIYHANKQSKVTGGEGHCCQTEQRPAQLAQSLCKWLKVCANGLKPVQMAQRERVRPSMANVLTSPALLFTVNI